MLLSLDALEAATLRLIERDSVNFVLVGCGGTGSWLAPTVVRTARLLVEKFNKTVKVVFVDPDTVEPKNCYRQNFAEFEIGQNKAETLATRYGLAWGLDVLALPRRFDAELDKLLNNVHQTYSGLTVVIGCVDNRKARKAIIDAVSRGGGGYWLDLGNRLHDGQVILGQVPSRWEKSKVERLPLAIDLLPEIGDETQEADDDTPSCSLADALEKQSLFVNRGVSLYALNLLWELFRYGQISYHGVFVNLKNARTTPLPVDPEAWARFGFPKRRRAAKRGSKRG